MIEIQKLNAADLQDYIESDRYAHADQVPISVHRAISHIQNPRRQPEDILLFVATENGQMVGYLGALPDDMYLNNGSRVHCAWMSCLWVDEAHRGKKIAQTLIKTCFDAWNGKILLTEFTAEAGALYTKMGIFVPFTKLTGRRWYIESDLATILPPKKQIFKYLTPILKVLDFGINGLLGFKKLIMSSPSDYYIYHLSHKISNQAKHLISGFNQHELFKRSDSELKWAMDFPWILTGTSSSVLAKRYYFSSYERHFEMANLEISDHQKKVIAMLLFTSRNGHLKIPYGYYTDMEAVLNGILWLVKRFDIHTLTIYHLPIIQKIQQRNLFWAANKTITRNYLMSSSFGHEVDINKYALRDGDGDCAFT